PPPRFLFSAPPTSSFYPLSLHDALPICFLLAIVENLEVHLFSQRRELNPLYEIRVGLRGGERLPLKAYDDVPFLEPGLLRDASLDRKSTRLNSSHVSISYAVFCLKKKKL